MTEELNVQQTTDTSEVVSEETNTQESTPGFLEKFEYSFDKNPQKVTNEEELRELVEMGRFYKERGKQSVDFMKEYAKKNDMSVSELIDAIKEQEESQKIREIAETQGVNEEIAQKLRKAELLEGQFENEQQTKAEQKRLDDQMGIFVDKYPDVKEVPQEVWDIFKQGKLDLTEAYDIWNKDNVINDLKSKLEKYEHSEEISNKNKENSEASTGSVTGNGNVEGFFSKERVKAMSQAEVKKNYNQIVESMKQWK